MDRGYRPLLSHVPGFVWLCVLPLCALPLCALAAPPPAAAQAALPPAVTPAATPSVQATPAPTLPPPVSPASLRRVIVNVDREGKLTLGKDPAVLSPDELAARLRAIQEKGGVRAVSIRVDERTPYEAIKTLIERLAFLNAPTDFGTARVPPPLDPPSTPILPNRAATEPPPPAERIKADMMAAREREQERLKETTDRLAGLPPAEREAFTRNLRTWQQMAPDERQALRNQARERNREEIAAAILDSGLALDADQREVFILRYQQERRKLERDLLERANAERARRLPKILADLKREFAAPRPAAPPPKAKPTPTLPPVPPAATPTPTPPASPTPALTPGA